MNRDPLAVHDCSIESRISEAPFCFVKSPMSPMKKTIFFVSTFPPRECGLATFTSDLIQGFEKLYAPFIDMKVIAINESESDHYAYPQQKVVFQISRDEKEDYRTAASFVNQEKSSLICVQHEFGIFGGLYGAHILEFLRLAQAPKVVVLHTVLPASAAVFHAQVKELERACDLIIVMTDNSKHILIQEYGMKSENIQVIPHGIPAVAFEPPLSKKNIFSLNGHTTLTTFGLLSRNKGIEYVLRALPAVVERHPNVLYLIVGATHPNVLKREGEKYRKSLIAETNKLGLQRHVRFYNKYFSVKDLLRILKLTDVYIATSLDPNQAVSGTLSYALGTGRPVISTNFSQAREFVTPALGTLVPLQDVPAYSIAILSMLARPERLIRMGEEAYQATRHMVWGNVALAYYEAFMTLAPSLATAERRLPALKLTHLERMTTKRGILQFCRWSTPLSTSGYTLDDTARALLVTAFYHRHIQNKTTPHSLASVYLDFILSRPVKDGLLLNVFSFEDIPDKPLNDENREDAHTRALLALSFVSVCSSLPAKMKVRAHEKFFFLLENAATCFHSPRAQALFIKALTFQLEQGQLSEAARKKYLNLTEQACEQLAVAYDTHASGDWQWFEPLLAYSNASLPEALFLGAAFFPTTRYFRYAETSLHFLLRQTKTGDRMAPIGQNGWMRRGGERALYDQQPEEMAALVTCLRTAWDRTRKPMYKEDLWMAFSWFLGNNTLNLMLYDEVTGGCYDGLTPRSVNLNQGAESTLAYLIARLQMEYPLHAASVAAVRQL